MALTYTTAVERADIRARAAARRMDTGDALLLATAVVALMAIALAYLGRSEAFELAELRRGGATPIDLNAVTNAGQLDSALRPLLPELADRSFAARQMFEFLQSNGREGRTLPNVGAILAIDVPVESIDRARAGRVCGTPESRTSAGCFRTS